MKVSLTQKQTGPAKRSAEYLRMKDMWQKMDAVRGGADVLRSFGRTYMPQHIGEERDRYKERLSQATLWNQLALTLTGWVGRPFNKPLVLNDDIPEDIRVLEKDIDRLGTNMDTFARKWFSEGVAKAYCHVLVEVPEFDGPENPTIADVKNSNHRPYWVLLEPEQVIYALSDTINGEEQYTHVRILETTQIQDPEDRWSQVTQERIRVYDLMADGSVRVEVYAENGTNWDRVGPPKTIGIHKIPLVTFYSNRQDFLLGRSPLQDLCDMNISHWCSQADQDTIITIARFPILAASGVDGISDGDYYGSSDGNNTKDGAVIGPYNVLVTPEPRGKYYYVEHSGKAIESGQKSLGILEAKMAAYGSEFLKKSPDRQTATARTLDSAESTSPLQAVVFLFLDAMQSALQLTADWMGLDSGGTVDLTTDFGPEEALGVDFDILKSARQGNDISRNGFLLELKRRGVLAVDFDIKANQTELEDELSDPSATEIPPELLNIDVPAPPKEEPSTTEDDIDIVDE